MNTFAVEYAYDITRTADIDELRPQHREFLHDLAEEGILLASGPWLDNAAPGALLLISAQDDAEVRRILDRDPFHRAQLITHRTVRAWNPVIGAFADRAE
ncbi:YciI family protein [Ruania halotolerans]|uniref:YciI family protein n=1 Tax=Ruania halotolerans TaxID=2897773 RepID=UPI001E50EC42|nr:YciI family protein [Ruania halotolerans]UFU08126.1 YciI family protein [Ruania halotolerans]